MGRIKPRPLKALTETAFSSRKGEFSNDFSANKKPVSEFIDVRSKKLRNVIAGYATRLKKRDMKE